MIATSVERVSQHTTPAAAQHIHELLLASIEYHTLHPEAVPRRLRELDREWDIERTLETTSASMTLLGMLLAVTRGWKWLFLSAGVQGFFLQHALQGWCPPLPLFRRFGVRTVQEIETERFALLAIQATSGELEESASS
jgi:hypothetical protein